MHSVQQRKLKKKKKKTLSQDYGQQCQKRFSLDLLPNYHTTVCIKDHKGTVNPSTTTNIIAPKKIIHSDFAFKA